MSERQGECVVLVAPPRSYRVSAYVDAARALEIPLILVSVGEFPLVPDGIEGISVEPGRTAPAQLASALKDRTVRGVVASDDATVQLASELSLHLRIAHNPPAAVRASRRKDLSRVALARASAPTPGFGVVHGGASEMECRVGLAPYGPPFVVKPLALSGSRGVIRCDTWEELPTVVARSAAIAAKAGDNAQPHEIEILVEEYLPGQEVAVEGMLIGGVFHLLALFDKPDPLIGPFFEETYYITPSRHPQGAQDAIVARVEEAIRAIGLCEGPIHAELRVLGADATVLEVAARTIGGDCARLLNFGAGRTLEQLVLLHAVGRLGSEDEFRALSTLNSACGVLMLPIETGGILRRVEGVLEAGRVDGVDEVFVSVREGYELVPLPEGASYLGFIFAHGETPDAVEQSLRAAHRCLRVVTAPTWRLEVGS